MLPSRETDQSRLRLAARAPDRKLGHDAVGVVRAMVDGSELDAVLREALAHECLERGIVFRREIPPGDTGLIGDYDKKISEFLRRLQDLDHVANDLKVYRPANVTSIEVEYAIPIEK